MILEMTASMMLSYGTIPSQGMSDAAQYVAEKALEGRRQLQRSISFGAGAGLPDELCEVFEECQNPNWDSHGASPVLESTYRYAYQILEAMPLGISPPSIGAEPDGYITIEWYRSPRRTISISVGPEGEIHYAALLGSRKAYGTEPFVGEIPGSVLQLIDRVVAG